MNSNITRKDVKLYPGDTLLLSQKDRSTVGPCFSVGKEDFFLMPPDSEWAIRHIDHIHRGDRDEKDAQAFRALCRSRWKRFIIRMFLRA